MIAFRPSRVLAKLRAGQTASCIKLNLADSRVAELAALCGFDCIWTDMEHLPNTVRDMEENIRAAKNHNCDVVVRVPRGSYSDLVYPLEMDAAGIMVPHVMTAREAQEIARITHYHPLGRRPLDNGTPSGAYCQIPLDEFMRESNAQRLVMVQIEDPEAMNELDAIAATDGIDVLFFGPADFSQGIGVPGDMAHPQVIEAQKEVAKAALRHGKFAGTVGSPASMASLVAMGYRFINLGADVVGLGNYFNEIVSAYNRLAPHA